MQKIFNSKQSSLSDLHHFLIKEGIVLRIRVYVS